MSTKVAELTVDELKHIIEESVERKLSEMLGNPDEGLELRPRIEQRLSSSLDYVTAGGKTLSLEEITTYAEFADEDVALAEPGISEYADLPGDEDSAISNTAKSTQPIWIPPVGQNRRYGGGCSFSSTISSTGSPGPSSASPSPPTCDERSSPRAC